ncbi:MAG: hypothetical protein IJY42_01700 [Clostridia bacterium]|nr:hypothetical protein [Clostridia bacterium]
MNEMKRILLGRQIPPLTPLTEETVQAKQAEWKELLLQGEYGTPLPPPESCTFEILPVSRADTRFAAGLATVSTVVAKGTLNGRDFSFPFQAILPNAPGTYPFVIHNDFNPGVPTKYNPTEELLQRGIAIFHVFYQDVTSDDGDFTNGLAGTFYGGKERAAHDPGKIAMWAWANMRIMDYAETLSCLDMGRAAVCGHSRLGKTALLTGMLDERFSYVFANDSGCSGDALARGNTGERIADIVKRFPYWFCPAYAQYKEQGYPDAFDQHMLIAAIAPRRVLIGAAEQDAWADPLSQYLSCVAASPAWEAYGQPGFLALDRPPVAGDSFAEGGICYHLRTGLHYLSRVDWNRYLDVLLRE